MSKQSEEKRAYWPEVLKRQRDSGLSVRQFCREQQVSGASFHSWKRKIGDHDRDDATPLEAGDQKRRAKGQVAKQTENTPVFMPMRVSAAAGSVLEIVHPRGHVLRVPAVFDETLLRRILRVLDRQGEQ